MTRISHRSSQSTHPNPTTTFTSGWETFQRFYNPGAIPPNYYRITPAQRGMIGLGYVGLIGSLALAMDVNERFKKPPEVLIRERESEMYWDMR